MRVAPSFRLSHSTSQFVLFLPFLTYSLSHFKLASSILISTTAKGVNTSLAQPVIDGSWTAVNGENSYNNDNLSELVLVLSLVSVLVLVLIVLTAEMYWARTVQWIVGIRRHKSANDTKLRRRTLSASSTA